MATRSTKVIGYFAYTPQRTAICDGDSCVIAGSRRAMERYIRELAGSSPATLTIKKTRFGEIMRGLRLGGPYSFDERAYARFLPLAQEEGIKLREQIPDSKKDGLHLVRVEWRAAR
jgi:hypothetical protein